MRKIKIYIPYLPNYKIWFLMLETFCCCISVTH